MTVSAPGSSDEALAEAVIGELDDRDLDAGVLRALAEANFFNLGLDGFVFAVGPDGRRLVMQGRPPAEVLADDGLRRRFFLRAASSAAMAVELLASARAARDERRGADDGR